MSSLGWVDASSERKKSDLKIYQNKKHLVQKLKHGLSSPYCGNTFSQPHCNDFTTLPYITTVSVSQNENKTLFLPDFVPCHDMGRV